ncbi:hypothetical protein [Priestia aryabhattai]|uniref:hypothetical protein n=1 Tax=Priestia aryabhattai TaxID=412384 RepID=UPI003D291178
MKKYKLATVLLSASLALSACGSDSEKEESKNDSEEATSAAASAPIHKKDTSDESKAAKTTGNLPDKEQQALDAALLMFTHAKNKNFNAFKNDMELRSKFSLDMYQSEPADSEYKEIMVNWATLNYANFNLKVIDWDKLSDATQIEIGEDYGGDSVLVSVTTKDDTLTQEEKEGMDIILIMNKYNNRYMMKEFKAADIIQDDINEQMYANTSSAVKDTDSEENNDNGNSSKEKYSQELTDDQKEAIENAKLVFKTAQDGDFDAFKTNMSSFYEYLSEEAAKNGAEEEEPGDEDVQEVMDMYAQLHYIDNYTFRVLDLSELPDDSDVSIQIIEEFGNQFVPIVATNNKSKLPQAFMDDNKEALEGQEDIMKKVAMDTILIMDRKDGQGEYKLKYTIPRAYTIDELRNLMYEHDPKTLNEINEAVKKNKTE